jgi:class 3 adenylate cyclase
VLLGALASQSLHTGAAIHTGQCVLADGDAHGIAVDIAGQLAMYAQPGEILVTQTVRDLLLGSKVRLAPRDRRRFDVIQGEWDVFSIEASHA